MFAVILFVFCYCRIEADDRLIKIQLQENGTVYVYMKDNAIEIAKALTLAFSNECSVKGNGDIDQVIKGLSNDLHQELYNELQIQNCNFEDKFAYFVLNSFKGSLVPTFSDQIYYSILTSNVRELLAFNLMKIDENWLLKVMDYKNTFKKDTQGVMVSLNIIHLIQTHYKDIYYDLDPQSDEELKFVLQVAKKEHTPTVMEMLMAYSFAIHSNSIRNLLLIQKYDSVSSTTPLISSDSWQSFVSASIRPGDLIGNVKEHIVSTVVGSSIFTKTVIACTANDPKEVDDALTAIKSFFENDCRQQAKRRRLS